MCHIRYAILWWACSIELCVEHKTPMAHFAINLIAWVSDYTCILVLIALVPGTELCLFNDIMLRLVYDLIGLIK